MKRKSIARILIAAFLVPIITFGYSVKGQATVSSDRYSQPITVGFTSMGSINSLTFTLTDDYSVQGFSDILKSGTSYRIDLANSQLKLYENDSLLLQTSNNLTIKPLNTTSFIRFKKEGYTRSFSGDMTFKINGSYFIPINSLKIEDYVKGVLPFEEGNDFPIEALKAQAVAARTYAIANKGTYGSSGYDLRDDTYSQVYRGFVSTAPNCNQAVDSTDGQVLTYGGRPISAVFSASNGGYMESSQDVWGGNLPYLISEADPYDSYYIWKDDKSVIKTIADIDSLLKSKYPSLKAKQFESIDVNNIKTYPSGRVSSLSLLYLDSNNTEQKLTITKDSTRSFFNLNSSLYTVKEVKDSSTNKVTQYEFSGSGFGHGVGLSQWGSYARAKYGKEDYKTILNFYYRNTTLENDAASTLLTKFNTRIGGSDRYSTSRMIADNMFAGTINNIVLATGHDFPDALSGAVLAKKLNSPILLVGNDPKSTESQEALNYISTHLSKTGKIYILGGEGVISKSFEAYFVSSGYTKNNIVRIGGIDRQETAALVASNLTAAKGTPVVISTMQDFPDALSISPIAAINGWPILLTGKDKMSTEVINYIKNDNPQKIYIVGGTGVVSDAVSSSIKSMLNYGDDKVIRLAGSDRYSTSRVINSTFMANPDEIILSTGKDFPDALSGSVYAALKNSPMMLVDSSNEDDAEKYIRLIGQDGSATKLTVLGSKGAVNDSIVQYLTQIKN